jgi:hypothetical protein
MILSTEQKDFNFLDLEPEELSTHMQSLPNTQSKNMGWLPFLIAYITVVIDVCVNIRNTHWLLTGQVNSVFGHTVWMLHLSLLRTGCYWLTDQTPINQTSTWNFLLTVGSGWKNWRNTAFFADILYVCELSICHKSMSSLIFLVLCLCFECHIVAWGRLSGFWYGLPLFFRECLLEVTIHFSAIALILKSVLVFVIQTSLFSAVYSSVNIFRRCRRIGYASVSVVISVTP